MVKILIAEDDENLLELYSIAMESQGLYVIKAGNGKIAWEILKVNPGISLLICDMAMPVMDGSALVMSMKADARLCRIPVLAVSGVLRAREIAALLEQGVTQFIAKPVDLKELTSSAKRLLGT